MVVEVLLGSLAEAIIGLVVSDLAQQPSLQFLRDKMRGPTPEKLALQRALAASYSAFSEKYPGLAASLFDEVFLGKREVVAELSKILTPNQEPNYAIIEALWKIQLSRQFDLDISGPLLYFLEVLENEVKGQAILKPFVDSRALEQLHNISDNVEDQTILQRRMVELLQEVRDLIRQGEKVLEAPNRTILEDQLPYRESIVTDFIGRQKELTSLWKWFNDTNSRRWALSGEGGKGKSAVAYEFALAVKRVAPQPFQTVLWLSAKKRRFQEGTIVSNVPDFTDLDSALSKILMYYGWLAEIQQPINVKRQQVIELFNEFPAFVIVDDVDSLESENEDVIEFFSLILPQTKSKVLFTSRRVIFGMGNTTTQISGFNFSEAEQFIGSRCELLCLDKASFNKNIIQSIVKVTDGSPLFIEDLMRFIAVSPSANYAIGIWKDRGGSVARAYALQREVELLSQTAQKVLLAACAGASTVSFAELAAVTRLSSEVVTASLQELHRLFLFPKPKIVETESRFEVNYNTKALVREVYGSTEQYQKIEAEYRTMLGKVPNNKKGEIGAIIRQSMFLIRTLKHPEAEQLLQSAMIKYQGEADLYSMLARVYLSWKPPRLTDARENFMRAWQLKCDRAEMYDWWATMELDQEEYGKAAEAADRGIGIVGDNKKLLYLAGYARRKRAQMFLRRLDEQLARAELRKARKDLEKALKSINKSDTPDADLNKMIYQSLVKICTQTKQFNDVQRYLQLWSKQYPEDTRPKYEADQILQRYNVQIELSNLS